jgi:hypothetical protein
VAERTISTMLWTSYSAMFSVNRPDARTWRSQPAQDLPLLAIQHSSG